MGRVFGDFSQKLWEEKQSVTGIDGLKLQNVNFLKKNCYEQEPETLQKGFRKTRREAGLCKPAYRNSTAGQTFQSMEIPVDNS